MHIRCTGAPSSLCGCLPALAWECCCVPPYQAAFQTASSLVECGRAGKENLFVSSSGNGKDISLHPLMGMALRLTKHSLAQEQDECWECWVLPWSCASQTGSPALQPVTGVTATPACLFSPSIWSRTLPTQELWFVISLPAPLGFETAFSGSPVFWVWAFIHSLFYYIMHMAFFLCFSINGRWFPTV